MGNSGSGCRIDRLHIVITYNFPDGQQYEEKALFQQQPELVQEQWSWKESQDGQSSREFTADFLSKTATLVSNRVSGPAERIEANKQR